MEMNGGICYLVCYAWLLNGWSILWPNRKILSKRLRAWFTYVTDTHRQTDRAGRSKTQIHSWMNMCKNWCLVRVICEILFLAKLTRRQFCCSIKSNRYNVDTNLTNVEIERLSLRNRNKHRKGQKVFGWTQIHSCINSEHRYSSTLYKFAIIMFAYTLRKRPILISAETTKYLWQALLVEICGTKLI
jgi:hypothetical protein